MSAKADALGYDTHLTEFLKDCADDWGGELAPCPLEALALAEADYPPIPD